LSENPQITCSDYRVFEVLSRTSNYNNRISSSFVLLHIFAKILLRVFCFYHENLSVSMTSYTYVSTGLCVVLGKVRYYCLIPGSLHEVDEFWALLGYYKAYNVIPHRRFATTYRSHLQGSVL